MKITRFKDIPRFTQSGSWQAHYDMGRVIPAIDEWVDGYELDLEPDFQRLHVWTPEQQTAWIEFFMRGGKTGRVIYFNCPGWMNSFEGPFVLVDGKQRIQALRRFFNNEIPVFGSLFNEFSDSPRLLRDTLEFCVNDLPTRAEVLQWYIEMNSGGTQHTPEEIEKAQLLLEAEEESNDES